MKTPEEKLCSRGWRLLHSSYLLWSILSFGMLTSVGFWVIGIRSRRRSWLLYAALWTVFNIAVFAYSGTYDAGTKENPIRSSESNIFGGLLLLGWIGGIVHSVLARRGWLRWRAYQAPGAWYLQGSGSRAAAVNVRDQLSESTVSDVLEGAREGHKLSRMSPHVQTGSWAPPPHLDGATSAVNSDRAVDQRQPGKLDLNSADVGGFMSLGITREWADWLITTRTRLGGFSSVDQLVTEGQLPPHVYIGLRDRMQLGAAAPTPPPAADPRRPGTGRRLDL
ncbi:hypothetical protein [Clavibacter zhangzhiyongii]|uniref:hypothetical protein n=1 Tax=Clavibacter zhangzhiyongii TaxID=2768071 RepID=UPI001959DE7C|nr:hypothetical protein [Clavibacter zhangzhiyongii]MBM7026011.1 hypothetical protein [Clavibacter zhangzhiyongii]